MTTISDTTSTKKDAINCFTFNQTAVGKSVVDNLTAYVGSNSINSGMSASFGDLTIKGYLDNGQK
jgi:hypothetical protein